MSDYLSGIESIFEKKSNRRTTVALIMAYWVGYALTGNDQYLHKAFFRAQVSSQEDFASVEILFCRVFILVNRNEYSEAYDQISKLTPHKNFYKNSNPLFYEIYIFLNALIEVRIKNHRAANKYFRMLEEALATDAGYALPLMMGILRFETGDYGAAANFLRDSYQKGCNSGILYAYLHMYFHIPGLSNAEYMLFGAYIRWSAIRGIKPTRVLAYNKSLVPGILDLDSSIAEILYPACPDEWLLIEICKSCIKRADYSEKAQAYLHEAEARQLAQIDMRELSSHLLKCAFVNKTYNISRYMMETFVSEFKTIRLDDDFKAFVFHILLNNKKFAELAAGLYDEIIIFAIHGLENNLSGNYYNSIYKTLLEITYTSDSVLKKLPPEIIDKAEKLIFSELFMYEISPSNSAVKQVWIIEKEKKDLACYPIENGKAVIRASSEFFSYVCFGNNSRHIVDSTLDIVKRVENADIGLYLYFCKKLRVNTNLMINMARYYIASERRFELGEKILKQLVTDDKISISFRYQINAALGNYRYQANDINGAALYYRDVDINNLNDKHIEQILNVFMSVKQYDMACALISKKAGVIPDKALFSALKQLCSIPEYRPVIAGTAYGLVLRSWYDKALLSTILEHYNASQEEWQELSRALANISVSDSELDEIILKNAIWMHKLDVGAQKVFARMPESHPLVQEFAYYCVYEIIMNSSELEYDSISILEKIYFKTNDRLYAYALTYLYINQGITTIKSDDIIDITISYMTEDGLIFPIYKTNKDKRMSSPYIEQNQPFMYKCAPGKDVVLYYRADNEKDYRQEKMKYLRFGLYYASVPHFFGEKLSYYFSEEMATGSITTKEVAIENNSVKVIEEVGREDRMYERFFNINNALVYEQMFRYDMVEKIITDSLRDLRTVRGEIM